jgi:hypothetical protein
MKKKEVGFGIEKQEKFEQKFPIITGKDLRYQEGKEREMIELIGYKLGKTNQELLNIIVDML